MKRTALSTAILLALTPALAHTQDAPETEAQTLDTVQVTASRIAQTVDETLSSVTVIDREEIERLQPKEVADLLSARAGLDVTQNAAYGKETAVRTRGTESGHTLLLVDGVRMGSATSGSPTWQFLPVSEIERVEIVRGPRTSIYGSDAVGGVIQVFTREGQEGPPKVNAFVGGGSFNTREFGAGVAGGTGRTDYSFSFGHFDTVGFDVQDGVGDSDADGFDNTSMSGKVAHRLDNGVELFGSLLYSEGTSEFDGFVDETEFVHAAIRGGVRLPVARDWDTEISVSQSRDESDNLTSGTFFSRFDTRRDMLDWRNDIVLGSRTLLIAGADLAEEHVDATDNFEQDSRYNAGVFSVLQTSVGRHDLEGSLRYDDNEQFGDKVTGQVAWGTDLTGSTRLRASYGTAFNVPTFNDLYYPYEEFFDWETGVQTGSYQGNPDLNPEESQTIEVGLRHAWDGYYMDAAIFQTDIEDLIQISGDFDRQPENVSQARIRGLELEGGYASGGWHSRMSLTLLDAENRSPIFKGNELTRRSPVSARVDLDRQLGDFSVGGSVIARARSYNDAANNERLSGYGLLNLRGSYAITPEWSVEASLNNVFDRDYALTRNSFNGVDYNQPGRAAFVKLRYQQR
ncbi:TonB-dependent receptor domain-containing protein [Thioalkalivibrio sp. ALE16]|uniref:TonB-dependent receptor domain-containing protein n=1 Tax=Thioalkalivibrio sp. ALE16 TaxID=1158172 RepID=UPI000382C064|nr:TonB-dependent receptor [Thioalkalivibrio sp. ALE16]